MSKDFTKSLAGGGTGRGSKKEEQENSLSKKRKVPSRKKGLKEGETRVTFILPEEQVEKIKAVAYWDSFNRTQEEGRLVSVLIKDIAAEAVDEYLKRYERKNGKIKPIPEE